MIERYWVAIIYSSRLEAYDRDYVKAQQVLHNALERELSARHRNDIIQKLHTFGGR